MMLSQEVVPRASTTTFSFFRFRSVLRPDRVSRTVTRRLLSPPTE
jgi:hypothetical protein